MHPKALALQAAGLAHQQQGDFQQAREAYLQALALDARLDAARLNLGAVLTELGDFEGAIAQYRKLLDHQPESSQAMLGMVRALGGANRLEEAGDFLDRLSAQALDDVPLAPLRDWLAAQAGGSRVAEIRERGRLLLSQNQPLDALPVLRRARQLAPDDVETHLLLAEALGRTGDGEGAWEAYAEVTAREPNKAGLSERLIALCRQEARQAQGVRATHWWERLLGLVSADPEALQALEASYASQSRVTDLIRLLQTQAAREADPAVILRLGQALGAINRTAEALALYQRALADRPDALAVRRAAATLALLEQRPGIARQLLTEVADLPPDVQLLLARAHFEDGRAEEGWGVLRPLLSHEELGEAARALGEELLRPFVERQGDNPQDASGAAIWWRRLLACRPGDPEALDALEALYRELERPLDLAEILAMRPAESFDGPRTAALVEAWLAAGRPDSAHAALANLMARGGESPAMRMKLARLSLTTGHATRAWQELEPLLKPPSPEAAKLAVDVTRHIALKLQENGDYAKATGWWKLHLHYHPQSPELKRLADAQLAAGDLAGAAASMRAYLRHHPDDEETALTLAGFDLEEGRYAEAEALYQAILARHPDHLRAVQGMAEVAAGMGDDDASLTWSQRLLEIAHDEIPELVQAAREAMGRTDDEEAWKLLRKVLSKDPSHAEAHGLAVACLKRMAGNYYGEIALAWWQELLGIDPQNLDALRELARGAVEAERREEATERFQEIVGIDPEDPEAALWLGREHLDAGRHEEARQTLSRSKEARGRLEGILILAELALIDGDTLKARSLFGRAVGMSRGHFGAMAGLAKVTLAEGKFGEAWIMFKRLLQMPEGASLRDDALNCLRGLIQASPGMAALPWWMELLKLESRSLEALRAVATLQRDAGALDVALAYAHRALGVAPGDPDAQRLNAEILRAQGRTEAAAEILDAMAEAGSLEALHALEAFDPSRAIKALERQVSQDPGRADLRRLLATWSLEHGRPAEAWPHLEFLLMLDPGPALTDVASACLQALAKQARMPEEAAGWWEKLLALEPEHDQALAAVAAFCRSKGQAERADELTRRLIAVGASSPEAALYLGATLEAQDSHDEAMKAYALAAQAQHPEAFLAMGRLSMLAGETARAQVLLEKACQLAPGPASTLPFAQACLANGEALAAWEAMKPWVSEAEALKPLALAALDHLIPSASDEDAPTFWEARLALVPDDSSAQTALFRRALANGDAEGQVRYAEGVLAVNPRDPDAALALGLARWRAGENAEPLLRIAAEHDRQDAFLPLAQLAWELEDAAKAREWLERLRGRQTFGEEALRLELELARYDDLPEEEWRVLEALDDFESAPTQAEAKLAVLRRKIQSLSPEKAGAWLDRALDFGETGPLEALALRWLQAGAALEARDLYARLLVLAPDHPEIHAGLGAALLQIGDRQGALLALRAAYRSGDRHEPLAAWEVLTAWAEEVETLRPLALEALALLISAASEEDALPFWEARRALLPDDPAAHAALLRWAVTTGDTEGQVRFALGVLSANPRDPDASLALGLVRWRAGENAESLLRIAAESDRPDAFLPLAQLAWRLGDAVEARAWLERLRGRQTFGEEALRLELELARYDDLPEEEWRVLEALDDFESAPAQAEAKLAVLRRKLSNLTPGKAGAWLDRALDFGETGPLEALALSWLQAGAALEARDLYARLLTLAPERPEIHAGLGAALLALGERQGAMGAFEAAAHHGDRSLPNLVTLLDLAWEAEDFEKVRTWAAPILALAGKDTSERALALERAAAAARELARRAVDPLEQRKWWLTVLEHAPEDLEAMRMAAALARSSGDGAAAATLLDRLHRLQPKDRSVLLDLAAACEDVGNRPAARHALEQALALSPEDLSLAARVATLLIAEGDQQAAEKALVGILRRDSGNRDALLALAALKAEAAPEEALILFEQALKRGDDLETRAQAVSCALRVARAKTGPAVVEAWKRLLRLDPENVEAFRAIADDRLAAGRPDEALSALFSLAKHDPTPETLFELARALEACRQPNEARAFYLTLANQYDHLPAWQALAEMALASGDFAAAYEAAQRLVRAEVPAASELLVRALRELARASARQADFQTAATHWNEVLTHLPEDLEALEGLAAAAEGRGDFEEAEELLRRLEPLDPGPRSSVKLAEILFKRGQDEDAERLFSRALAADPEEPHAHAALARLAQGRGDFLNAGDHAQRALMRMPDDNLRVLAGYCARQLAEASRLKREVDQAFLFADLWAAYAGKTLDWQRFRAELARDAGRREMAVALYLGILLAHPEALEDALSLTRCYADPREARPLLERVVSDTRNPAAAHALAMLAQDDQDAESAVAWWKEALSSAPENAALWRRLADCYRRSGRYAEACAAYARLEELTPADPVLLKAWGNAALSGELWQEARVPFTRLAEGAQDAAAMLTLAQVAATLEDHAEAWRWSQLLMAAAVQSGSAPNAEVEGIATQAAKALAEATEGEEALGWWERYLELAPQDLAALLHKARLLADTGRLEAAIATLHHALELAPGDGVALRLLADCHRKAGDLGAAEDVLQTALHEDPKDAEALFSLAELAWDRGDVQAVWELGQQLLKLSNRDPRAQGLIARCAKLLAEEASAQGDWENAILYWELLLSFDIDEETALTSLSQAYVSAGRYAEAVGIQREVVRIFPQDPDRRFRLGEIAVMGGFWEEARTTFMALRDADPAHVPTHHALASVALALDDLSAAEGHFLDVLAQATDDLRARLGLARLYLADSPKRAWDILKPAATEPPVKGELAQLAYQALDRLAEEAAAHDRHAETVDWRREAVALDPLSDEPVSRFWRRKLAASLMAAGRKPEAIRELASLLESDPGDVDASYLLGTIHRQSSDLESACRIFERILELVPAHVEARIALAEINWEIADLDGAWLHVQEALQVQPTHEAGKALFRKLALAFAERSQQDGELAEAVQWWNLVWLQDKRDLETLRKMARAHIAMGQLSAAADCYAFALDVDPKDLETAHILADIHRQRGDLKAAEKPLLRIVALDPRHAPSVRALLKLARDRQIAPEALKRAYDLLDVEPNDPEALYVMAWAHQQMLERRAALEACKELIAIDPQHADGHHLMGQIARDLGDYDLAKKVLTTALYLRPCAAYYHTMGTVYAAMGYSEESLASFKQAIGMDPEHADAHADLGLGLIRSRQAEKAKPHLQKALSLIPRDTERSLAVLCALDLL